MWSFGPLLSAAILAAAALAMFADVLFSGSPAILSRASADLAGQYLSWRAFGFGELSRGNLALWNPHIFLGAPYLGGMQSALLYPPNWIDLLLPLPLAINWGIASHVFLVGLFTCLWSRQRGLAPLAALLAGLLAMFCGAHFLHVSAGHLSNLCSMAWMPLLLLAVDGWLERRGPGWLLLGAAALALQILAGHPQYVAFTAIAVGLYALLRLPSAARRLRAVLGLAAMVLLGTALSAVQLLPALDAARENVRSGGTSYAFAASFSLPPENLLTLVLPYVFGGGTLLDYWGRSYSWETGLFLGVTGSALALLGALAGERSQRRVPAAMALVLLTLALGAHTPLFRVLYDVVPGFGSFRGSGKFAFQASIFLSLLAGLGLDRLLRAPAGLGRAWIWVLPFALACAGACAWVFAVSAGGDPGSAWGRLMHDSWTRGAATGEAYLAEARLRDAGFVAAAGRLAAASLLVAAATAAALAFLLRSAPRRSWASVAIASLAFAEVFVAARLARPSFRPEEVRTGAVDWQALPHEADQRILDPLDPDRALATGALDVWGADPGVSRRYAEFMTATQGGDPDQASQYLTFRDCPPIYRMLRLRHALLRQPQGWQLVELADPLPRLLLLHECRVEPGRDAIFAALAAPGFDPASTAILEREPRPAPEPVRGPERVELVDESTDQLTIEAQLSAPGLLLVTDGYSEGWVARALPGSAQADYQVLPADYVLRAVPLQAGRHRLRLEYAPAGFRRGAWISSVALLVGALAGAETLRRRSGARRLESSPPSPPSAVR